jgi:hypothetical protein
VHDRLRGAGERRRREEDDVRTLARACERGRIVEVGGDDLDVVELLDAPARDRAHAEAGLAEAADLREPRPAARAEDRDGLCRHAAAPAPAIRPVTVAAQRPPP